MKSFNTSLKKDNEGIVFMDFPGVVKPTKEKKNKHVFLIALIIILVCMLYVLSAMLNEKYLYGNSNYVFNVANKFDGDVAVINKKGRKKLFRKIGFEDVSSRYEVRNSHVMEITEGSHFLKDCDGLEDLIKVYYDKNNKVNYIDLTLVYKKNNFNSTLAVADVNSILKNFISVSTYKSYIEKALKDGKYMINETKSNIRLSYLLTNEYDDYYSLNIIVE